jgi:protein O-GlcNAc transferase
VQQAPARPRLDKLDKLNKALSLQNKGRLDEASKIYRQILSSAPGHPDALHFLGMIAHQHGRLDEAAQLMAKSLTANPNNPGALNNLAGVLKDQRQYSRAADFYEAALAAAPANAAIHSNLGVVLIELKRLSDAAACFDRAIQLDPQSYAAYSNLGTILQTQGEFARALQCYGRALAINQNCPQVLLNMGAVLNELGHFTEAVQCYEALLELDPNSDAAYSNLAAALKNLARLPEAIQCCWRALKINPRSHLALNNLGNALKDQGKLKEAAACFQKALEIKPDDFLSYNNLGLALKDLGSTGDAFACLHKAAELSPADPLVRRNLGSTYYEVGNARAAVTHLRKALELRPHYPGAHSDLLLALNYLPRENPAELFAEHVRFGTLYCDALTHSATPHPNVREPARRLRIGYVSGDLRDHPVAQFIEPVFNSYSREGFEVYCYANHRTEDAVSQRMRGKVDHWRNIITLSDDQVAAQIRQDGIDILVDLSGHTAFNRLMVFARKPAPVQLTMIGYMQTTGISAMDYRITDETLDPVGLSDQFSTEKLIRLPAGAAPFRPPADCPPVNALPALTNGYVTFASFNNLSKVTPEVLAAWAQVLHTVPGSKLLVVGREGNSVAATMESHGIGAGRLEVLKRQPMKDYLALHHRVDFVLDAFPYNGGTTNLIAAWMGLPYVTLVGNDTVSRVGEGILKAAGLPQLAATDIAQYVSIAADAVSDLQRLAEWRAAIRPRLEAWAGDGSAFTLQLEDSFRQIWRTWCER